MMGIKREGAFVVQNGLAEICQAKPGIPQIVEEIGAPLPRCDKTLVTLDCLLEVSFIVFLGRLCEYGILICASGGNGRAGQHDTGDSHPP